MLLRSLLFCLQQPIQPNLRVVTGLFPSQFRRKNVPSHKFVQSTQIIPVDVYPLFDLVLKEGLDDRQGRLHVPGLAYEVDALESGWEAVLQPLDHQFEYAGLQIGSLAERELGPVDYDDEAVGLVVDLVC